MRLKHLGERIEETYPFTICRFIEFHGGRTRAPTARSCGLPLRRVVVAVARDGDEGVIEVELQALNDLGEHVSGTATIGLPIAQ